MSLGDIIRRMPRPDPREPLWWPTIIGLALIVTIVVVLIVLAVTGHWDRGFGMTLPRISTS